MLNKATVDAIRNGTAPPSTPDAPMRAYASGGPVVDSAGGGTSGGERPGVVVQIVSQTLERLTDADFERMVERQVAPAVQRAIDRGVLTLTPSWWTG